MSSSPADDSESPFPENHTLSRCRVHAGSRIGDGTRNTRFECTCEYLVCIDRDRSQNKRIASLDRYVRGTLFRRFLVPAAACLRAFQLIPCLSCTREGRNARRMVARGRAEGGDRSENAGRVEWVGGGGGRRRRAGGMNPSEKSDHFILSRNQLFPSLPLASRVLQPRARRAVPLSFARESRDIDRNADQYFIFLPRSARSIAFARDKRP